MFLKNSRVVYREQRQVAVVRDMHHPGWIGLWIAFLGYRQETGVADNVRVGHDSILSDDESRSDAARNLSSAPRRAVIRFLRSRLNPDQAVGDPRGFRAMSEQEKHARKARETTKHGRERMRAGPFDNPENAGFQFDRRGLPTEASLR